MLSKRVEVNHRERQIMNMKKKIAVIGLSYPFRGGISHYSTLLVRELRKKHDVKFITLYRQYPSILFPGKTQYDYSKKQINEQNDSLIDSINPLTWIKTAIFLFKENVDIVIIQWWHPFFAFSFGTIANLISLISNTKICFLCHNVIPHESTFIDRILIKYAFLKTNYFIVHSEEDKKNLFSFKPNAVLKRNIHPTYSEFSNFSCYEKKQARELLTLNHDKKVVLFFGLIRPYKGLKYLIYAMKEVVKHIDCILLVVGEFYEPKDDYLSIIDQLGLNKHIIIIDKYVKNEDVPLYFGASDVVVLPYISATQSGIVQIAYGLNRPVITTNVGGLPEVVQDGKTGFIVEPESPESLSQAIIKFYKGDYEKYFCREIKKSNNAFSWENEINSIEFFMLKKE